MWRLTRGPGSSVSPGAVRPIRTSFLSVVQKSSASSACGASQASWPIEILLRLPAAPCMSASMPGVLGECDVSVAGLPEEVLLEREFHRMGLRPGDEHPVLAGWEHLVGQDDH